MSNAQRKPAVGDGVASFYWVKVQTPQTPEDPNLRLTPPFTATLTDWDSFHYEAVNSFRYAIAFLNREISNAWFWQKGRLHRLLASVQASASDLAELNRIAGKTKSRSGGGGGGGKSGGPTDGDGGDDPPTMAQAFFDAIRMLIRKIVEIFDELRKSEVFKKAWADFWQKAGEEAAKMTAKEAVKWAWILLFGAASYPAT